VGEATGNGNAVLVPFMPKPPIRSLRLLDDSSLSQGAVCLPNNRGWDAEREGATFHMTLEIRLTRLPRRLNEFEGAHIIQQSRYLRCRTYSWHAFAVVKTRLRYRYRAVMFPLPVPSPIVGGGLKLVASRPVTYHIFNYCPAPVGFFFPLIGNPPLSTTDHACTFHSEQYLLKHTRVRTNKALFTLHK
jgi:hypothetical protein